MENLPRSTTIEKIRTDLSDLCHKLNRLENGVGNEILHGSQGALTCIIISLGYALENIIKAEIANDDNLYGESLKFSPRGIGSDHCPGCFVCGAYKNDLMSNIASFINSREDGEKIVEWFDGLARIDYRDYEPDWIQLKVGSCGEHVDKLKLLYKITSVYGIIRRSDIDNVKNNPRLEL